MKRTTKHLPDVDLNGRVRRHPVAPDERARVKGKFLDGPLAGQEIEVPKGADYIAIGPKPRPLFVYSYSGREGRTPLYCKKPTPRKLWRFVLWFIASQGKDPRVMSAQAKSVPVRRDPSLLKHGRGAVRRAAKHAAA